MKGQFWGIFLGTILVYLPHIEEFQIPFSAGKCDSKTDFLEPYLGLGFDTVPQ